jgi:hypothetical protein
MRSLISPIKEPRYLLVVQNILGSSSMPDSSSFQAKDIAADSEAVVQSQLSRERGTAKYLCNHDLKVTSAVQNLNLYCKKTKAVCEEAYSSGMEQCCTLTYRSKLRTVLGSSKAGTKKGAKKATAANLLMNLKRSTSRA